MWLCDDGAIVAVKGIAGYKSCALFLLYEWYVYAGPGGGFDTHNGRRTCRAFQSQKSR